MEYHAETVCRLCLNVVCDGNYKAIEESTREVLRMLNLNVEEDIKSVICTLCCMRLFKAQQFKATCMDTQDNIFSHVNSENTTPVDLREIYLKVRGEEHLATVMEDERICRLCMHIATSGFTSLDVEIDMLQTCIPEINFSLTREPIICARCLDYLNAHSSFLKNCLAVMEQIKSFPGNGSSLCIKSEGIEIKSEKDVEDSNVPLHKSVDDVNQYNNASQNSTGIDNDKYFLYDYAIDKIEHEDNFKVGHQESDFKYKDSSDVSQHSPSHENISEVHLYACDVCNFKAKRKDHLTKHQLKHKSPSEVQMYHCITCDFKTKYKEYLARHQLLHKGFSEVKMYTCDTCGFETKRKDYLARHQLKHENTCNLKTKYDHNFTRTEKFKQKSPEVRMYDCGTCVYKTKYKSDLLKHQLTHKDSSQVQMYKCDTCDFETKIKGNLKNHMLRHKDISKIQLYKCDRCDYKAKLKHHLVRHQLTHKNISKVRLYECDTCGLKAKCKDDLTQHLLKHTDCSQV